MILYESSADEISYGGKSVAQMLDEILARLKQLEDRIKELDHRTVGSIRIGGSF